MIELKNIFVQIETWKIYPTFSLPNQVILLDAQGKEVYKFDNIVHGQTLDISRLPPGIYSIKVYNDDEEKFLKIVKQ